MNAPLEPERRQMLTGGPLSPGTRQRLLALIKDELVHVRAEALAEGMPTHDVEKQVEQRVAELRRQVADEDGDAGS